MRSDSILLSEFYLVFTESRSQIGFTIWRSSKTKCIQTKQKMYPKCIQKCNRFRSEAILSYFRSFLVFSWSRSQMGSAIWSHEARQNVSKSYKKIYIQNIFKNVIDFSAKRFFFTYFRRIFGIYLVQISKGLSLTMRRWNSNDTMVHEPWVKGLLYQDFTKKKNSRVVFSEACSLNLRGLLVF